MAFGPSSGARGGGRDGLAAARWAARRAVAGALLVALGAGGGGGCRSQRAQAPRPVPVLAASREAQTVLRRLEQSWLEATAPGRAALEPQLRDFLARFPGDDGCRLARTYLAFVRLGQGDAVGAQALVEPVLAGPPGSTRDLARVVAAGVETRQGRPRHALALLAPLSGKLIAADERTLFAEQQVLAAFDCGEYALALRGLEAWLVDAPPPRKAEVEATVAHLLERCPLALLEATGVALDARAAATPGEPNAGARDALRRSVRARLLGAALAERDAELAQRLIARSPGALLRNAEGDALVALAATGTVDPRVTGRTIGVVLSLGTADSRRRSAAVVAGVSRALRLASDAAGDVRMATRDDGGDPEAMAIALAALAGEGAGVLVAGVEPDGARRALAYAETVQIPALVLSDPEAPVPTDGFGFVVGVDEGAVRARLLAALGAAAPGLAPIVVGPGGLSCETQGVAGRPRFPVSDWRRSGAPLLLTGDGACVHDALASVAAGGHRAPLAVALDGAEGLSGVVRAAPTVVARVGRFPATPVTDPTLSLFQVLGHDAALLAAAGLGALADPRTTGRDEVAALHRRVRDRLAVVSAELWSTSASGFAGQRVLERAIEVVPVGGPKPGGAR